MSKEMFYQFKHGHGNQVGTYLVPASAYRVSVHGKRVTVAAVVPTAVDFDDVKDFKLVVGSSHREALREMIGDSAIRGVDLVDRLS